MRPRRSTDAAARRELEDLRAAINHHRREGLCNKVVEVVLPPERPPRERWLTRSEAARLIWSAWRYREVQKGRQTDRRSRQHVAHFILVALYTGTRASAVCGAALQATVGHGWVDLDRGVFYRRPAGHRETKKRQPPVPLPDQLLAHLRRWKRRGQRFAVEWNCEVRCRASIRRSPMPSPMPGSAMMSHRTFYGTLPRHGSCKRHRPMGGRWLSRYDRRDALRAVWASSS